MGFKLGSFGFVFLLAGKGFLFVTGCFVVVYVHFGIFEIGFVLHKRLVWEVVFFDRITGWESEVLNF